MGPLVRPLVSVLLNPYMISRAFWTPSVPGTFKAFTPKLTLKIWCFWLNAI